MPIDFVQIVGLLAVPIVLLALLLVIRSLKLPESFYEKEKKRVAMRARLIELEFANKEEALRLRKDSSDDKKPEAAPPDAKGEADGRKSLKAAGPGK